MMFELQDNVCIDVVLRLMFLCNVNNVQPSSWTSVEDRQGPASPPVSASARENDSRASGPVHPSPARPVTTPLSHHAQ